MNAYSPPEALAGSSRAAIADANEWRGASINQFARGERILREALHEREPNHHILLTGLVINRLLELEAGKPIEALLEDFRALYEKRHAIVHGVGRVYSDHKGNWCLRLDYRNDRSERREVIFEEEGQKFRRDLQSVIDRIRHALKLEPA